MESNSQLVEWEVGVGFFVTNTMKHVGSVVWYFVAESIEEAEILLEKEAKIYCDRHAHGTETFEFSHEWLSMCAVNQSTWEPHGESIPL